MLFQNIALKVANMVQGEPWPKRNFTVKTLMLKHFHSPWEQTSAMEGDVKLRHGYKANELLMTLYKGVTFDDFDRWGHDLRTTMDRMSHQVDYVPPVLREYHQWRSTFARQCTEADNTPTLNAITRCDLAPTSTAKAGCKAKAKAKAASKPKAKPTNTRPRTKQ